MTPELRQCRGCGGLMRPNHVKPDAYPFPTKQMSTSTACSYCRRLERIAEGSLPSGRGWALDIHPTVDRPDLTPQARTWFVGYCEDRRARGVDPAGVLMPGETVYKGMLVSPKFGGSDDS